MEIYLDSSRIGEIEKWKSVISGVTTNPTVLKRDGTTNLEEVAKASPGPISIEVCGDLESEARKWSQLEDVEPVIKIPLLNTDGSNNLELISKLVKEGIVINCTALMSLSQVVLASLAGAQYVSLFVGRMDDEGVKYYDVVKDCVNFLSEIGFSGTELIVGSMRTVGQVLDAIRAGAHIVTVTPALLEKMAMHRYSLDTVKQFERDALEVKLGS